MKSIRSRGKGVSTILFLTIVILFLGGVAAFLSLQKEGHGVNPIKTMDFQRSKVLVTGEDYSIEGKRAEAIREEEGKKEEEANTSEENSNKAGTNTQREYGETIADDGRIQNGEGEEKILEPSKPEEPQEPKIECTIEEGTTQPGQFYQFWVKAWDYQGYEISRENVYVDANGERLYSSGADGINGIKYRMSLSNGENKVTVTASDSEGHEKTVTYSFWGDETVAEAPIGEVYIGIEATTLSLGYLCPPQWVPLYPSDNIPTIIHRQLAAYGYTPEIQGSVNNGYYLARIHKVGITQGYAVVPELKMIHDEEGTATGPVNPDSLGGGDAYKDAGWWCMVDRQGISVGIAEKEINDGSYIQLVFTTDSGYEYDGRWSIPGVGPF